MSKPSLGGSRYFVTFIDDKSRKIFVYFMKTKDEVFDKFKNFKNYVQRQTERKIKAIRSDNGREYINGRFDEYLEQNGIRRQLTVPHTPQQNGVAERANRTIVEMARSMIVQSGVNEVLWAEAVNTAVYLRNRSITKILHLQTPFQVWSGKKPNVQHLKIFGAPAIALDKTQKRKFLPKGKKYIFVGYSLVAKAYRLYDAETHKIVEKRDVRFNEEAIENLHLDDRLLLQDAVTKKEATKATNTIEPGSSSPEKVMADNSSDSEDMATAEEDEETEPVKTGPGRLKIIRTGKPGRPRKVLNTVNLVQEPQKITVPLTVAEAMQGENSQQWLNAMENEYAALIDNKTWELAKLPKGQKAIGSKWVFSLKYDEKGNIKRFKSRLVAKGCNQKRGVNYEETFSPVVRHATIRMVLALAVEYELHLHQLDVSTAYLNSELEEEVYMLQPENFTDHMKPNQVLKLKKAIYGLKQSGRVWNQKLDGVLRKMGFTPCESEPCLYIKKGKTLNMITVYVDDLIIGSQNEEELIQIKSSIAAEFEVVDGGQLHHFLGLEICRKGKTGSITISQEQYTKNLLEQYNMLNCRPAATPLEVGYQPKCPNQQCKMINQEEYQSLIGALTHLAIMSRPDIMHSTSKLAQSNCNPHHEHMTAAKHVLRYLNSTINYKLHFEKTGQSIQGFVDADWGGDTEDRKSYTGCAFKLANAVFSWESRKQPVVALSSTEAEYIAMSTAAKEAVYLKKLLGEIGLDHPKPIVINGDNLSAQQLVKNPVYQARSKHIDIRFHHVRNVYKNKDIELNYICTNELFADVLTKNLPKVKHLKFVKDMGLH